MRSFAARGNEKKVELQAFIDQTLPFSPWLFNSLLLNPLCSGKF